MFMNKMTLLSIDQVFGDNKIDIIKKYGTKCGITDFSILLDGFVLNDFHVNNGFSLIDRTGMWLSQTPYNDDNVYIVDHRGCKNYTNNIKRQSGGRPVLLWDSIFEFYNKFSQDNIIEVEYCEYPQEVVNDDLSYKLEVLYGINELEETGKVYTTDCSRDCNSNAKFMARDFIEYIFEGKKYIRFATEKSYSNGNLLSDGRKIYPNYVYWVRVDPIVWIIDLKNHDILSKNILFSGIQFNNYNKINTCFEDSDIYYFLNEVFSKNIIPIQKNNKKLVRSLNYY